MDDLCQLAATIASEARSCLGREVPRFALSPGDEASFGDEFKRQFLEPSVPVILTGACERWPSLRRWTHAHLRATLGSQLIHVALTPNGLADAVTAVADCPGSGTARPDPGWEREVPLVGATHPPPLVFAQPLEVRMPCDQFFDAIERPLVDEASGRRVRDVHYASHQDSSLHTDFGALAADLGPSPGWADAAFGGPPAAMNLWIGEDAARTSVHADLFDNLYVVLSGEKRFTLLPPDEGSRLGRRQYRAATYARRGEAEAGEAPDAGVCSVAAAGSPTLAAAGRAAQVHPDVESVPGDGRQGRHPAGLVGEAELHLRLDEPPRLVWWSPLDLESNEAESLEPICAVIRPGELLYLPALWWHAVSQKSGEAGSTMAINFWYDRAS